MHLPLFLQLMIIGKTSIVICPHRSHLVQLNSNESKSTIAISMKILLSLHGISKGVGSCSSNMYYSQNSRSETGGGGMNGSFEAPVMFMPFSGSKMLLPLNPLMLMIL